MGVLAFTHFATGLKQNGYGGCLFEECKSDTLRVLEIAVLLFGKAAFGASSRDACGLPLEKLGFPHEQELDFSL